MQGAIYCRISRDSEGLALGVERQREDCLALAAALGIEVKPEHVLIENDVGASTKSKKARPEYARLKELVVAREVQAVIFYSNSRLTRRPEELGEWITLHEQTGVRLHSKVSGDDDLGTADGRMVARIKASVDAAEAERISERVKRSFEQRRQNGLLQAGGTRAFGFDAATGSPSLVPAEAAAIHHGAALLMSGATFGQVAREWTERGVQPVRAKAWTRESVRSIYRSARLAGLIEHDGEIVGPGVFPAILDRATWEAVTEAVQHGPQRPAGYGQRAHVLSGYVYCGVCGARMVVSGDAYRCVKQRQGCGGVKRNKAWLDAYVDGYVRAKLAKAGTVEVKPDTPSAIPESAALEVRIAEVRQQHIDGTLDAEDFFPLLSGLRGKLTEARKVEAEQTKATTQRAALLDPMKVWEGDNLLAKRALLAGLVQGIYVMPVGRIGRAPIPVESVKVVDA